MTEAPSSTPDPQPEGSGESSGGGSGHGMTIAIIAAIIAVIAAIALGIYAANLQSDLDDANAQQEEAQLALRTAEDEATKQAEQEQAAADEAAATAAAEQEAAEECATGAISALGRLSGGPSPATSIERAEEDLKAVESQCNATVEAGG